VEAPVILHVNNAVEPFSADCVAEGLRNGCPEDVPRFGKLADLIALERNLFEVASRDPQDQGPDDDDERAGDAGSARLTASPCS
jgi:hypothetical protein